MTDTRPDLMRRLVDVDPEIARLIDDEGRRQHDSIRLIASENYVSQAVIEATANVLTNKYSEGYPGRRYYEGQQVIDQVETLAIERAKALFGVEHANVQTYSGSPANLAVYMALAVTGRHRDGNGAARRRPPDARVERVAPPGSGSGRSSTGCAARTAGSTSTRSGRSPWPSGPVLIFCGGTAIPRTIDFAAFAAIAEEVGRGPGRRHRPHRRAGRRRRPSLAGRTRRR